MSDRPIGAELDLICVLYRMVAICSVGFVKFEEMQQFVLSCAGLISQYDLIESYEVLIFALIFAWALV